MKRVKLIIAYDGTNYCGWQIQINGITVEEVLNKAISELTGVESDIAYVISYLTTEADVEMKL